MKAWLERNCWFILSSACAMGAVWNAKRAYFYWAAYFTVMAADALLEQLKPVSPYQPFKVGGIK